MHDQDSFLDAAAQLFATGGARSVTMAAVARTAGAPSGSVYHRFPDRPALLAALWLRSTRRFFDEYLQVIGPTPEPSEAITAAAWIVDWCRDNFAEANVLQAGARTFEPAEWPEPARTDLAEHNHTQNQALATIVQAIAARTGHPPDHITFALIDLPLAAVRPYILQDKPPPARATELVTELAESLLATTPPSDV